MYWDLPIRPTSRNCGLAPSGGEPTLSTGSIEPAPAEPLPPLSWGMPGTGRVGFIFAPSVSAFATMGALRASTPTKASRRMRNLGLL